MHAAYIAQPTGDHDGLVIAPRLHATRQQLFETAEIPGYAGPAEFIVEGRRTQRTLDHDVQRTGDAFGFADALFPRPVEAGNTQVRHRVAHQSGLGLRAQSRCALVADLAARTGGCAGERRDGRGVVVRLDLHQDVD